MSTQLYWWESAGPMGLAEQGAESSGSQEASRVQSELRKESALKAVPQVRLNTGRLPESLGEDPFRI